MERRWGDAVLACVAVSGYPGNDPGGRTAGLRSLGTGGVRGDAGTMPRVARTASERVSDIRVRYTPLGNVN